MVLASARLRGIHPPDNIQNGGRPGGMPLKRALARQHFDDHGVAAVTRVDLLCALFCGIGLGQKTVECFKTRIRLSVTQ